LQLIEKIDLNNPDKLGNTSLHQACLFDQSAMIQVSLPPIKLSASSDKLSAYRPAHLLSLLALPCLA
jgi:ankyrin repeat protein